jgi:imidazolonepropionase-like amidohydrolase
MLVIEGGRLLLPDGTCVIGDLGVDHGRIVAVGKVTDVAGDGERLDARGCTVIPGLIDMHSHLTLVPDVDKSHKVSRAKIALAAARQAVRALRAGITRCRDIGGYRHVDLDLRNAIEAGLIPGPKMVCAGKFIAITGGHAWPYIREADGEAEVRKAVREQIQAGADFIKLMGSGGVGRVDESEGAVQFSFAEVKAIVEEAEAAGTVAAAHVHPERAISNAVRAGVRSIEHGTHLTPELASAMVDQGTFLVPTFAVYRAIATDGRWPELAPRAQQVYDTKIKTFLCAVERGVRWGIGTDAGSFLPVSGIADEMEIAHGLGFSPVEVLQKATQGNAELWNWSDVGRLEVGLTADLILVAGDPTTNLSDVRQVQVTIARGKVYDWRVIDSTPGGAWLAN